MALPSFFKSQQIRSFNFTPRYYDERKEKFEERVKTIEQDMGVYKPNENYKPQITRGSMRGYFVKNKDIKKRSNIRLYIILGSLLLLVYLLLYR